MRNRLLIIQIFLILADGYVFGQTPPRLSPTTESKFALNSPRERLPIWGGGALVRVASLSETSTPTFSVYNRNGQISGVGFSIPGVDSASIYDYSRGANGTIAFCGLTHTGDSGYSPYAAWISPDGFERKIIYTAPYYPHSAAVSPDGTIWTLGYEMIGGSEAAKGVDPEAGVIRRFDKNGVELGRYVPRSSVKETLDIMYGRLAASSDRVAWFPPGHEGQGAYIEVLASGTVNRYPLLTADGPIDMIRVSGLALTSHSNQAFLTGQQREEGVKIYALDRDKRIWVKVPRPASLTADTLRYSLLLLGSEGDELAFFLPNGDGGPHTVQFFSSGK